MVIRNEQHDTPIQNLMASKLALELIKLEYESCIAELENKIEVKTKDVVKRVILHFSKPAFVEEFTTWRDNECPEFEELTDETEGKIEQIIKQKFEQEIQKWEAENHVIKAALESLMKRLKKYSDRLEFQIKAMEEKMLRGGLASDSDERFTTAQKVALGVTSPLWLPFALVGGIVGLPVMAGLAIKGFVKKTKDKKIFKEDKKSYIAQKSSQFLKDCVNQDGLRPFITPRFEQVKFNLDEMKSNFSKLLDADMFLILKVLGESVALCDAAEFYTPINADCSKVRGELSIFTIKEIIPKKIESKDLQWNKDLIGSGAFADVYKGTLKTAECEEINVAVKISRNWLTEENAHELLSEELILRYLKSKLF